MSFLLLVLLVIVVWRWWKLHKRKFPSVAFYANRESLNEATGGLQKELDNLREGWVMWPGGVTSIASPITTFSHIERLMVLDPENQTSITEYCRVFFASKDNAVSSIKDVTRRAQEAGVRVRWSPRFYLGFVIHDPRAKSGLARIEIPYPGIVSAYRSNFTVTRSADHELFETIIQAYECAWKESKDAPGLVTQQVQPGEQ